MRTLPLLLLLFPLSASCLPYHYSRRNVKRNVRISPSLNMAGRRMDNDHHQPVPLSDREDVINRYNKVSSGCLPW